MEERSISQGHRPNRGNHDDDNKSEMYGTKSAWTDASAMFVTEHERQKLRVVRKLITICSIDDKEVKKGFTRLLGLFTSTKRREDKIRAAKSELEEKTKNVLSDPAKFDDFKKLTEDLLNPNENFLDTFIKMIKVFIISPIELGYITKLEDELAENEKYEAEIQSLSEKVKRDKETRLKTAPTKDNCEAMMREIAVFENKLEKANQRLNETIAYNAQLREKINELRKEKLLLEDVEKKLKNELEEKREKVEKTIQVAGQAYLKRNEAEKELEALQEKAKKQREDFEAKIQDRNKSIEDDRKFKNFLKTKQKEKAELEALEKAIAKNLQIIKEKEEANAQIEQEYMQSTKREEEIRQAFDRIKKETGITHCEELLERFTQLNEKNATMTKFVEELTKELEDLEKKIADVKKEIQYYNTKGATNDNTKREKKIELSQKILQEEKKKQLYKSQYEKSLETINFIKEHLEKVFDAIEVEPGMIENLKNSAVTEENMMYYLGILEQKGIEIISEYSRLIAEQLKMEKGDSVPQNQIDDLNNIIAYENATMMNYYSNVDKDAARNKNDFPEDILPAENNIDNDKWMSEEELRKSALQFLTKKVNMDTAGNGTMGAKTSSLAPKDKRKKTVVVKK